MSNTIQMYDAQVDSIKIEDIATDSTNRSVLRQLMTNSAESTLPFLLIHNGMTTDTEDLDDNIADYVPEGSQILDGWVILLVEMIIYISYTLQLMVRALVMSLDHFSGELAAINQSKS